MIQPLYDRVIVKRSEAKAATEGGLMIPEDAREKPLEGIVLAVGKGRLLVDGTTGPLELRVGDQILFGKYAGAEVKMDEGVFLVMKEDDVLCVLNRT